MRLSHVILTCWQIGEKGPKAHLTAGRRKRSPEPAWTRAPRVPVDMDCLAVEDLAAIDTGMQRRQATSVNEAGVDQ